MQRSLENAHHHTAKVAGILSLTLSTRCLSRSKIVLAIHSLENAISTLQSLLATIDQE